MADKKNDTADTLRSTAGKGTFIKATKHEGGDTRGAWEDKLDARMEQAGYVASLIAKKFENEGIITINEDGKTFHIAGENGGEVYGIKMLPLVWAALKKKK